MGGIAWITAGQIAAWRLKWVAIPLLIVTAWLGRKLYRSIKLQPEKVLWFQTCETRIFCVVIRRAPDCRVDRSDDSRAPATTGNGEGAAYKAYYYTFEAALLEYQAQYQTLPADTKDLQKRIPDPHGTLAEALRHIDPAGYRPVRTSPRSGGQKSASLRGAAIRKASLSSATDDTQSGGLAFTTYELQLPGDDKILGNEDDWIAWNGGLKRVTEVSKGGVGRSVSAGILQP